MIFAPEGDRLGVGYLQSLLRKDSTSEEGQQGNLSEGIWVRTNESTGLNAGRVSIGFIQATPGEIKSLRSSLERMALILPANSARAPRKV